jgi:DNA-binding transcriptional ArsR family regulator
MVPATFNNMVERYAEGLDKTYVALANPVRRQILHRLTAGSARVTDIAEPFDISLAAVSKHVHMLERAGLVSRKVAGRDHWLQLNPLPLSSAGEWIERNRVFWEERLDKLEALMR